MEPIIQKEFEVNEYITLRLEDNETFIYINGKRFRQCKYLLFPLKREEFKSYDEIDSIDEAAYCIDSIAITHMTGNNRD